MADLEREIETLTALREATREAREAAKDLRAELTTPRPRRWQIRSAVMTTDTRKPDGGQHAKNDSAAMRPTREDAGSWSR